MRIATKIAPASPDASFLPMKSLIAELHGRRNLLVHSVAALGLRGLGAIAGFSAMAMATRVLGAHEAGLWLLALAFATMLSTVARLGLDNVLVREVGANVRNLGLVSGIVRLSLRCVLIASLLLMVTLQHFSDSLSRAIFSKPDLAPCLQLMALSIPFVSLAIAGGQALQGLHRYFASIYLVNISTNAWLIVGLVAIGGLLVASSHGMAILYVGATALSLGAAAILLWPTIAVAPIAPDRGALANSSAGFYVADICNISVQWAAPILAGVWLSSTEVARLSTAQRAAVLVSILLMAFNAVLAPRFALLYRSNDLVELKRTSRFAARTVMVIAFPVVALLWLFSEQVMGIFGEEFRGGAPLLRVLAVAQLVNAATGPVGELLAMCGHERDWRNSTFMAGATVIAGSALMIPLFGVMGAATATACGIVVHNLLTAWYVRKRLGFFCF